MIISEFCEKSSKLINKKRKERILGGAYADRILINIRENADWLLGRR